MRSRFLSWLVLGLGALITVYVGSYLAYRDHHNYDWQGGTVVIFARHGWRLALYRPLERLDHALTGAMITVFPEM